MRLARLPLALLCACGGDGLQTAPREGSGSAVHIEGLTADTWEEMFHGSSSSWLDSVRVPPQAQQVQSVQEHMKLAQQSARNIGRQMGVPYMPHDWRENLGDGSVEGVRAKAYEHFGAMKRQLAPIAGVIDYGLSQIGGQAKEVDPQEAFEQYSMVAERMGAKSLAHQLAPLLRATTPPNPSTMFNLIGSLLTTYRMPAEAVNFYREMAGMFTGGRQPTKYEMHNLQNVTLRAAMNRTAPQVRAYSPAGAPPGPKRRQGVPDYYKSTTNLFIIVYQLPCVQGSKVCFSLTNEFYSFKSGPGFFKGMYNPGAGGGVSMAAGIATQTPWSFISTPFYLYPANAVGHEYDLKFVPGSYSLGFSPTTTVAAVVKLRESSDCLGTGTATADSPRVDTCPLASLVLSGGSPPQMFSVLEILPLRAVGKDSLVSFYDIMKYGGPVFGKLSGQIMPDWAWAGFYRQLA